MSNNYEPEGIHFQHGATGKDLLLVTEEGPWKNWICYRHPDGQWVSLRIATKAEIILLTSYRN